MNTTQATDRDALTRRASAFRSYAALTSDMERTGYYPTLSRSKRYQAALGRLLEAEGRRVYWVR